MDRQMAQVYRDTFTHLTRSDTWLMKAEIDDASGIVFFGLEIFLVDSYFSSDGTISLLFSGTEFEDFSGPTFKLTINLNWSKVIFPQT